MTALLIERLGHRGDGIAAGPVYVTRALPGERVRGEVVDGRIERPEVVEASPARRDPECPHYASCGGCALQHAADDFVTEWKIDAVRRALQAHGIEPTEVTYEKSPPRSRRRATLHARRTKKTTMVGFHSRASAILTNIPDCQVLRPELVAALPALAQLAGFGATRRGELDLSVTDSESGLDIAVTGGKALDLPLRSELAGWAEKTDVARLTWSGEQIAQRRPPAQRFGHALVVPPPGAFLQATKEGEAALVQGLRDVVGDAGRVADLFAGCGTFTLPLAERAEVHAVESDSAMLHALDAGWRQAQGLRRVSTEMRDLFRRPLLPDELDCFDAVVLDPPRAGGEAQCEALADSGVTRVAMVSCNPVTFARDANLLVEGGFCLQWLRVVDQFRWSPHIELVASFARPHIANH